MSTGPPFPRSYRIPRQGVLAHEEVTDVDQLRLLRTELELLRRIRRKLAAIPAGSIPLSEAKYSDEDRQELRQIIRDAQNPVVEQLIARVDQEFDGIRKEILMSVIDEQAQALAHEAMESGAAPRASSPDAPGATAPLSVEDALAAAEAELARVAASITTPPPDGAAFTGQASQPATPTREPRAPTSDAAASQAPSFRRRTPSAQYEAPATPAPAGAREYMPDRVQDAVVEIEAGIRRLAAILSDEVNGQWKRAEGAFTDLVSARSRLDQVYHQAASLIAQMAHLREEAEIARDDAEVARREAKLMRDDTRRAKERTLQASGGAYGTP